MTTGVEVSTLMSGGGVGVGDSLETLNTSLVMTTCTREGRLLLPGRPLTVTPLQLQRMAARQCSPLSTTIDLEVLNMPLRTRSGIQKLNGSLLTPRWFFWQ